MGFSNDLKKDLNVNVDFRCPECLKIQPEILNINVDNKKVEFHCIKCAENEYNSHNFKLIRENNITHFFCKNAEEDGSNNHWVIEDRTPINEIREESLKNFILKDEILKTNKEIIEKKNEQLKKIIKFNKIIKQSYEKYKNNYFYLKSFDNVYKSFEREKLRNSNELKFLFTAFNNEIEISDEAIEKLFYEKDIEIEREVESLLLNNKELKNEDIKCISKIKFNQLKEIDLSGNEITNIEPLFIINLPFLEFLNLSNNYIENIEPLREKNLKPLKYLFIQNNKIKDIQIFLDKDFPVFDILKLENNNIEENSDPLGRLISIYTKNKKILITKIDELKSKYNIECDENKKEMQLEGLKGGDLMLKYIFINIPSNNNIEKLNLAGNEIEDPSILNRIQFNSLEELDLSRNNIKNLNFLKKLKAKNLKNLFLNNNKINNMSLLYNIKKTFAYLENITFNDNNCSPDDSRYKYLEKNLDEQQIKHQIKK